MSMYDDATLADRLAAALPGVDHLDGRLVVLTLERTSMANSSVFRTLLAPYAGDNLVVGRTINASAELFRLALNVTPEQLSAINGGLLQAFMPADRMNIRSFGGTDLDVEIESDRYRWISNRGKWRPGGFTVLPPGEVATMPRA
jgi:leucyl aminopeptidase (aminopeptidase T)